MNPHDLELYAWVGPDDQLDTGKRTGEIGIKQGLVPAGYIPLVAIAREKMERQAPQMADMAVLTGVERYLVRFQAVEVIRAVHPTLPELGESQ